MPGDDSGDPQVSQHAAPAKDAYVAGHDIVFQASAPAAGQPERPRRIWGGVPARNPSFTGRGDLLRGIRDGLSDGGRVAVQALRGMGGVGKTQLAIEYAHRYAADYTLVWWLNAENATLLGEQFAVLASKLGCANPGDPVAVVRHAVLSDLHERDHWLLIFDNAETPEDIVPWLPAGGHVLITSRATGWDEIAVQVEIDVLARAESVAILHNRVRTLTGADAAAVAAAVGDLPLAVAQAAGYLAETGMPAIRYVALLKDRAAELLREGKPPTYRLSLAAVTELAYNRLRGQDEAAADLAAACAFLAPEPIPTEWFLTATGLPAALAERFADPIAQSTLLATLTRSALIRLDPEGMVMHRLTQAILRALLPADAAAAAQMTARSAVTAAGPGDKDLPATWPAWSRLLPHLLALKPAESDSKSLCYLAADMAWYLTRRGDFAAARDLSAPLYEQWQVRLGADHLNTLRAANALAEALRGLGRYAQARDVDDDSLARYRQVLGEDDPDTLASASNLTIDLYGLREFQAARELGEDVLARKRRVLGEDHPGTLISANNLAATLSGLGEFRAARELDEDTLTRRRRVLGEDHPDTLTSASNFAADLRDLGEFGAARELDEDTLTRRRRVLGAEHPATRRSEQNLAADLRGLAKENGDGS
jgi:tetratricopeptide (TPR) repeat protein